MSSRSKGADLNSAVGRGLGADRRIAALGAVATDVDTDSTETSGTLARLAGGGIPEASQGEYVELRRGINSVALVVAGCTAFDASGTAVWQVPIVNRSG
jgi:hypothetical protein